MKVTDLFPRDTMPDVFKKKKFKKTNKVPKLKKSVYGVGGLNAPGCSSDAGGGDAGGGDGGGGGQ